MKTINAVSFPTESHFKVLTRGNAFYCCIVCTVHRQLTKHFDICDSEL